MGRRTVVALLIVAVSASGTIASCSRDSGPATAPDQAASSSPSRLGPPSAETTPSGRPKRSAAPRSGTRTLATPPTGTAPEETFTIEERHLTFHRGDRPLPTTVWAPAADHDGPFPLVLFSHGLTSEPEAYASILTRWAKAGFVVAAPAYPHTSAGVEEPDPLDVANQPADASYAISRMLALNRTAGDALEGRIDITRVGAAGHSAGGITTIGLFTGDRDDRLDAGIVLAGQQVVAARYAGRAVPMLFVHGKLDTTVPYARGFAAFQAVPWSRAMLTVTTGRHATVSRNVGPVLTSTTDFLRWSLYGDSAAKARLKADATKGGVATFTDQL